MRLIHLLARLYPYWALAVAIIMVQLGIHFRRKGSPSAFACWGAAGLLVFGIILWFAFRGDLYSDAWVRGLFG